ncbi:MAG: phosphonate C-P lyase system protein PhnK [Bryobacterales bacterium]|jgi:putative phosphonate transport system ATP-binding protein|nr:phosphonate C-P lyase system protein PhnK [Bryobacterales bacterium]
MSEPLALPLAHDDAPFLRVHQLSVWYGRQVGCDSVCLDLSPGEVLAIVGESGSGKSTLLRCIAGLQRPTSGNVWFHHEGVELDLHALPEPARVRLVRSHLSFVAQNPRDGLRMRISAGGNLGEPLLANGARHYGQVRSAAMRWMERVELDPLRIDEPPMHYSGGMQQRLQIARSLVNQPRLVCMDEPTGGLDVSVQAKLLDLLRRLVDDLQLSVILVTHDLGVARLLAERMIVMQQGRVIEAGLTDQVLDDPRHPYTQLLASSILS